MTVLTTLPPILSLRPDVAELARVLTWADQVLTHCHAGKRDRYRLDLVLTEVVTNILMHAFPVGVEGVVELEARASAAELEIAIRDNGPAFDPLAAPVAELPKRLEEARLGGLGLLLIRNCCDAARYIRQGRFNCLTLIFHLAPPGSA